MVASLIDGKAIAAAIRAEVKEEVSELVAAEKRRAWPRYWSEITRRPGPTWEARFAPARKRVLRQYTGP